MEDRNWLTALHLSLSAIERDEMSMWSGQARKLLQESPHWKGVILTADGMWAALDEAEGIIGVWRDHHIADQAGSLYALTLDRLPAAQYNTLSSLSRMFYKMHPPVRLEIQP